ncbi:GUN4 domain-containing protein [Myxosarcina sp. GI1]|uniref:GUN4 domain-containing protein n=1 Tax=Myxosarcina sp. GI1 TaxID=1541065 RepID=UPI00068E1562|nr:GUN4 domain-containing protein [Myxosarcina sp. GI1]
MNFSQIISILFFGGAIAATVQPAFSRTTASLIEETSSSKSSLYQIQSPKTQLQLAQALQPEQINLRAKQITVRIDGANLGSGAIIAESNNVYTVLTNWHVVRNPGQYSLQTIDGREHQINSTSIRQIAKLDLAIVKFESNQNYQVAELGDSGNILEGQSIYFAGYPGEQRQENSRYYRFFAANLVGILPNSTANGYSLIYNGEAFPGMSGGPVFDKYGNLIGIHGEANINAITGGTSNYAIPINAYRQAIAQNQSQSTVSDTNDNSTPAIPEIIIEPQPSEENRETEANSNPDTTSNTSNSAIDESTSSEENTTKVSSEIRQESSAAEATPSESGISSIPTFSSEDVLDASSDRNSPQPNTTTANEAASRRSPQSKLISATTSIDYRPLKRLLEAKKWEDADRQTYQLIDRIVTSAKQQNQNIFIELKTIADFACSDIRTIDSLWQQYSGGRFGFTPQQKIWQNVDRNGDFSTAAWRSFATQVGWKQGEIASAGGYLLYEQLNFNPERAPEGHLPWWFALPEEQQNVLKHLFTRCNLDPSAVADANRSGSPNNEKKSNTSHTEVERERAK